VCGEQREHAFGLETLAYEIAVQPLTLAIIGNSAAAQPFRQGNAEKGVGVELGKSRGDRLAGYRFRDAGALDLQQDASRSAPADGRFRPGNRARHPDVVYGPFGPQPCDRVLDVECVVPLAPEALPHLRFGELAAREQLQAVQVGPVRCQTS